MQTVRDTLALQRSKPGSSALRPGNNLGWERLDQQYSEPLAHQFSLFRGFIGRPFVKRFDLCYRTVVCPVCLSVTLLYCGQTVGWMKMPLGMEADLGPGHIVLDGDLAIPSPKGHSPQFLAHIPCGQMAGWIKMLLGVEVGIGPGDFVLDGDPAPLP